MNPAFVRLYPRSWRDRYGDEFEAMLEQQRLTFFRFTDVLLGALDAHLTARSPERRGEWFLRLPALLIAIGALVWGVAIGFREAGLGQDVVNVASVVAPFGELAVGLGVLALPSLWIGRSRVGRWINLAAGVAIVIGASYVHLVHLGLFERLAPGLDYFALGQANGYVVEVMWIATIVWSFVMASRSHVSPVALALLCAAAWLLSGLVQAGFGPTFDPAWGPQFDLPTAVAALAWLCIGVSILRPARRARSAEPALE